MNLNNQSEGERKAPCARAAGCQLAVRCLAAGPKPAEALLGFQFLPRRWYHVALSHSAGSALAPAWVRLYVNGGLEAHERLKYPKVKGCSPPCMHGLSLLLHVYRDNMSPWAA